MSITDKTRHCKCKCRLDASVCNNKQHWNNDKCRCECQELIDKGMCDKGFTWNASNCECEFDKLCDVGEYLDYKNCKCRKRLIDKLVENCNKNVDGNEITYNNILNAIPLNYHRKMYNSCTVYIVLLAMFFKISIIISSVFI